MLYFQGKVTVDSIDDKEDMMFADQAYDVLGFSTSEKYNIYKLTSVVMHMGNLTKDFVPVGKEEQADVKDETNAGKVATICGIDTEWMNVTKIKPIDIILPLKNEKCYNNDDKKRRH